MIEKRGRHFHLAAQILFIDEAHALARVLSRSRYGIERVQQLQAEKWPHCFSKRERLDQLIDTLWREKEAEAANYEMRAQCGGFTGRIVLIQPRCNDTLFA